MGDRLGTANHLGIQRASPANGMRNEYGPKCGDALRLGSKARHVSLHNADKRVWQYCVIPD